MKSARFGNYDYRDAEFDDRPKGELFRIGVNPYNGLVMVSLSNYSLSSRVAIDVMRQLVKLSDLLELCGKDPLKFIMSHDWDSQSLESLNDAAMDLIEELKGRSKQNVRDDAADSGATVKKAS